MQNVKMKPNLAAQMNEHEMPEFKGKWRNYWIFHCGKSRLGDGVYDTVKDARAQAQKCKDSIKCDGPVKLRTGGIVTSDSHRRATVIQIPVTQ